MSTENDLQQVALEALHKFVSGSLVFLSEGAIAVDTLHDPNGSATLLKTPGGKVIVLTARHVLEDAPPNQYAIGGRALRWALDDALGAQYWHPTVDVAVAELKPHVATRFAERALSCELIASTNDDVREDDSAMICGFPAAYRRFAVDERHKRVDQAFGSVTYITSVNGKDDRGRYRVHWGEAVVQDSASPPLANAFGVPAGTVFELAHPRGISGGPLWRFRRVPRTEIWAATRLARIVGVASTFAKGDNTELCPSASTWSDWLRETIAQIDE